MIGGLDRLTLFVLGVLAGVALGLFMAPGSEYPVRIPCPDPAVNEDDACVVVPLWAVEADD